MGFHCCKKCDKNKASLFFETWRLATKYASPTFQKIKGEGSLYSAKYSEAGFPLPVMSRTENLFLEVDKEEVEVKQNRFVVELCS